MLEQAATSGQSTPGTYSQTLASGNFYIVLTLSGPQEEVGLELGRNTIARIEEIIFQTPEIVPAELVEILAEEFANGITLSVLVAKIEGQRLALAGKGEVVARLARKGKIIRLLVGAPEAGSVSGTLHHSDLLVLGTAAFFEVVLGADVFKDGQTAADLRDATLPKIEALADNAKVAAIFLKINLLEAAKEEEGLEDSKGSRQLYLRRSPDPNAPPPPYRKVLYLAIVVFLTFISLVAFQLRSKALEQRTKTVLAMEKQAKDGLNAATKLAGVNDNTARTLLAQTRQDIAAEASSSFGQDWQKENTSEARRVKAVLDRINAQLAVISHVYNLAGVGLFYDFGLLKANANVVSAGLHKGEIVALDQANGAVYSLDTKSKAAAIITGTDDLKSGKSVDFAGDSSFVLANGGIYAINQAATTPTAKLLIKPADKWGQTAGLKTFAGNLYLLDKSNNQVWKYQGTDTGFLDLAPYLKASSVDFSRVTDFTIDGFVYVLSGSGNVVKFVSGAPEDFSITSLDKPLSNPKSIFASDETQNIYVLDGGNSRVVVLDKKGGYLAQYVLPANADLGGSTLILVDESIGRVFLVTGAKVYSFDLHSTP